MSKRVLLIDDERMLHAMLKTVLATHGIEVISAFTGEEGLAKAVADVPDMIILDVLMPGIKGREVCVKLKAMPETKETPVLFLTAKDSEDDVQAELDAGAVGHVTKPINSTHLLRLIRKILGA
jgi:DNA-binding response OmpR family regulator